MDTFRDLLNMVRTIRCILKETQAPLKQNYGFSSNLNAYLMFHLPRLVGIDSKNMHCAQTK